MNVADSLKGVRESGMCIACGACVHADSNVKLAFDDSRQMYAPDNNGSPEAAAVCPAVKVDYNSLIPEIFGSDNFDEHGVVHGVYLAQSTNKERNLKASSGGMIKELMRELLSSDDVDGIISLAHQQGLDYRPTLIKTHEEIDTLPGSIYHNLPYDETFKILREGAGRYIVIGIPCQIEGLMLYALRKEPGLRDKIHTTIGLVCGWNYSHHALKAICAYKGIDFEKIEHISYRGGGPVGKLRILSDNQEHAIHRRVDFSYQAAFDRSYNIPRCHVCVNHTNYLADIVVGDAWLPSTVGTKTGISIVVCRRERTRQLLDSLAESKRIHIVEASKDDITESQSRSITFGDFSYAYADFLRSSPDLHCPELEGPNRAVAKLSSTERVKSFHDEYVLKNSLQQQGLYQKLWWRKLTIEFGKLSSKYLRWFFVRILKVKSLFGVREEVDRSQTAHFN